MTIADGVYSKPMKPSGPLLESNKIDEQSNHNRRKAHKGIRKD